MQRIAALSLAVAPLLLITAASAQNGAAGYLAPGEIDILAIIPAAPKDGDARDQNDRAVFRETRAMEGSPRWELAAADADTGPGETLQTFSCAMGIAARPDEVPRLIAMTNRAMGDVGPAAGVAKDHFKRIRPYHLQQGATCRSTADLAGSFDFPSGHAMYGWTWATIVAQALPDRATPLLARGRAFGESRYICGMHNLSAVESGWFATSAILAQQAATPAYQRDLAAVREELAALRDAAHTPDPARCKIEREALAS